MITGETGAGKSILLGPRIATDFTFHFQQQKVVDRSIGQFPGCRQPGDATANDQHTGLSHFGRRRKTAIAQAMAKRVIHAQQVAGRQGMFGSG